MVSVRGEPLRGNVETDVPAVDMTPDFTRPITAVPRGWTQTSAPRITTLAATSLICIAMVVGYVWHWGSLRSFTVSLDPASAAGPCRDTAGSIVLFCDFAKHYYPQGQAVTVSAAPVPGFVYSAFFAVLMAPLASWSYETALIAWVAVVVASTIALYLVPQMDAFTRCKSAAVLYSVLFASSLPILHNFGWGQLSALLSVLSFAALVLYDRGHRRSAGIVVGVAASTKFYPAMFAMYFFLRRDPQALLAFALTAAGCLLLVPALVLGLDRTLVFYVGLADAFRHAAGAADNPYSNYVANAVSVLVAGSVDPASSLFAFSRLAGYGVIAVNLLVLYRVVCGRLDDQAYWASALIFTLIPFAVPTSWVHYFVYLPLVQTTVFMLSRRSTWPLPVKITLWVAFLAPSALLSSLLLFSLFDDPDTYYRSAFQFLSNAVLLPAIYLLAGRALIRPSS